MNLAGPRATHGVDDMRRFLRIFRRTVQRSASERQQNGPVNAPNFETRPDVTRLPKEGSSPYSHNGHSDYRSRR